MNFRHIMVNMFLVFALLLAPTLASANLVLDPTTHPNPFDATNPTFGGTNQRASNPLHDDGAVVVKASRTLTLRNTDPLNPLTGFTVTFVSSGTFNLFNTDIVSTTPLTGSNALTIANGATGLMTLEGKIPEDLDAIDANFDEKGFKVGTLTISASDGTQQQNLLFDVFMQRENLLLISDADAEINNKAKESLDDGDDIENLKPGDSLEITVEVENNYDDDDDVDINDVDLLLDCSDENQLDIDDESLDVGDISPDDEQTDAFDVDIEEDAEDGSVNCEMQTLGTDDNGARMGDKIKFGIEVERETHDIQIKLPVLTNPQAITCDDTSLQMTVSFINLGKSDEDEVAIEITSQDLNFQERRSNIELDEDDAEVEIFDVPLDKLPGKTPIAFAFRTFYDNVKSSDTETLLVENTCLTAEPRNNGQQPPRAQPIAGRGTLILEEGILSTAVNKFNSLAIQVTNNENDKVVSFEVSLTDITDFATPSSAKVVQLQPGQTSTVFLNFKTKPEVEEGTYTGTVTLRSGGQTVDTKLFTIEVAGEEEKAKTGGGINFDTTKVFWIIGDIILIIVAIFFIRLIFTSGRRKKGDKKMADYEAAAKQQRR